MNTTGWHLATGVGEHILTNDCHELLSTFLVEPARFGHRSRRGMFRTIMEQLKTAPVPLFLVRPTYQATSHHAAAAACDRPKCSRSERSEASVAARGAGYQVKRACVISGDNSACKTIFVVKGDGVMNSSAPRRRRHRIVVHQSGAHSNVPGRMCPCVVLTNQLLATL